MASPTFFCVPHEKSYSFFFTSYYSFISTAVIKWADQMHHTERRFPLAPSSNLQYTRGSQGDRDSKHLVKSSGEQRQDACSMLPFSLLSPFHQLRTQSRKWCRSHSVWVFLLQWTQLRTSLTGQPNKDNPSSRLFSQWLYIASTWQLKPTVTAAIMILMGLSSTIWFIRIHNL